MAEAIARLDAHHAIDPFSAGLMPVGFVPELTKQTLMKNGYWVEGLESKGISSAVWERVDVVINMSGRPKKEAFGEPSKVVDWKIEDPFERRPEDYAPKNGTLLDTVVVGREVDISKAADLAQLANGRRTYLFRSWPTLTAASAAEPASASPRNIVQFFHATR